MGQPEPGHVWDAGSVQLASWILTEANEQAAEIRYEARDHAATSLAEAKQEAAETMRRASDHAAATVAAAELQAAEIRAAAVLKLSTDLGKVASYVTENLLTDTPPAAWPTVQPVIEPAAEPAAHPVTRPAAEPAASPVTRPAAEPAASPVTRPTPEPATGPAARPVARPAADPATRPGTRPGTRPQARPGTRPQARPGSRSAGRAKDQPRQLRAIRIAAIATAALFLFAVGSGATEVALHGFSFFVFRESGAGETGPSVGTDQQFLERQAAAQRAHKPGRHAANSAPG